MVNQNNINLEEIDISFYDMVIYVLKKYKNIIIASCIAMVLVTGFCYLKSSPTIKNDFEKYSNDYGVYEKSVELKAVYEDNLSRAYGILEKNPAVSIDLNNMSIAVITFYINPKIGDPLNYSDLYNPADAILNDIVYSVFNDADWNGFSRKYDINSTVIKELVDVVVNYAGDAVTLYVYGPDYNNTREMLSDISIVVNEKLSESLASYSGYTIGKRDETAYTGVVLANDFEQLAKNKINSYTALINELNAKYPEPSRPAGFGLKSVVKYCILGFIAGAVAMCLLYSLKYLLSGVIHTGNELHDLCGYTMLGSFSSCEEGKNKFEKFLLKLQHPTAAEDSYVFDRISENISILAKDKEDVLLLGTVSAEKLNKLAAELNSRNGNNKAIAGGNLNLDNSALSKLKEAETVILVEEKEVSKLKDVVKEIEFIRNCDKKILGYIQY